MARQARLAYSPRLLLSPAWASPGRLYWPRLRESGHAGSRHGRQATFRLHMSGRATSSQVTPPQARRVRLCSAVARSVAAHHVDPRQACPHQSGPVISGQGISPQVSRVGTWPVRSCSSRSGLDKPRLACPGYSCRAKPSLAQARRATLPQASPVWRCHAEPRPGRHVTSCSVGFGQGPPSQSRLVGVCRVGPSRAKPRQAGRVPPGPVGSSHRPAEAALSRRVGLSLGKLRSVSSPQACKVETVTPGRVESRHPKARLASRHGSSHCWFCRV